MEQETQGWKEGGDPGQRQRRRGIVGNSQRRRSRGGERGTPGAEIEKIRG